MVDYLVQRKCRRRRILAEMYILEGNMRCSGAVIYTDSPNITVRITSVFCRFDQKQFWWRDKIGFFRRFSALQMLAEISEMISSDQTRSESVFTGIKPGYAWWRS